MPHVAGAGRAQKRSIHQHGPVTPKRGEHRSLVRPRERVEAKLNDLGRGIIVRGLNFPIAVDVHIVAGTSRRENVQALG